MLSLDSSIDHEQEDSVAGPRLSYKPDIQWLLSRGAKSQVYGILDQALSLPALCMWHLIAKQI